MTLWPSSHYVIDTDSLWLSAITLTQPSHCVIGLTVSNSLPRDSLPPGLLWQINNFIHSYCSYKAALHLLSSKAPWQVVTLLSVAAAAPALAVHLFQLQNLRSHSQVHHLRLQGPGPKQKHAPTLLQHKLGPIPKHAPTLPLHTLGRATKHV